MPEKQFRLRPDQIRPLAEKRGYCFATDLITCGGQKVGYMYREQPDEPLDSGWRFFSGTETQEYADNPDNTTVYDVNTIANYDPEIIPLLDVPHPIAFARDKSGKFEKVDSPDDSPDDPPAAGENPLDYQTPRPKHRRRPWSIIALIAAVIAIVLLWLIVAGGV